MMMPNSLHAGIKQRGEKRKYGATRPYEEPSKSFTYERKERHEKKRLSTSNEAATEQEATEPRENTGRPGQR
jgi:hypothetical protein